MNAPQDPLRTPYGGHPEFGPRVMANQAQPSLAGWEALAKDALLAWEECRAARSDAEPPTTEREALLRDRIWQSGYSAGRAAAMRAATEPADGLDEAWAEAEAALPEGWRPIHLAVDDDDWTRWEAVTSSRAFFDDETSDESQMAAGSGPTPAAALHALAAALRTPKPEGEPE